MLLNYNFNDNYINSETSNASKPQNTKVRSHNTQNSQMSFHLISEKIQIPQPKGDFSRERLTNLLEVFSERFGATLINGRAGTGKTTLAVDFAANFQNVAWFRIASTDSSWKTFSRYFLTSLNQCFPELKKVRFGDLKNFSNKESVQKLVEATFIEISKFCQDSSLLIVLDDLHNVFDAKWFEAFFKGILAYNFPNISILMLSRTQPPFPIWRLRSKQKLGYLDEKLLLFTKPELDDFFRKYNIENELAEKIHQKSFGRISKVMELTLLNDFRSSP
jgi:LuxR family maltose regulon positive regulatory protein